MVGSVGPWLMQGPAVWVLRSYRVRIGSMAGVRRVGTAGMVVGLTGRLLRSSAVMGNGPMEHASMGPWWLVVCGVSTDMAEKREPTAPRDQVYSIMTVLPCRSSPSRRGAV